MMVFRNSNSREAKKAYFAIERRNGDLNFSSFQGLIKKIISGNLLVLKNRFRIDSYVGTHKGQDVFVAQLFHPNSPSPGNDFIRLGSLAVDKNLSDSQIAEIHSYLREQTQNQMVLGPWNGHMNLGFTCPDSETPLGDWPFWKMELPTPSGGSMARGL